MKRVVLFGLILALISIISCTKEKETKIKSSSIFSLKQYQRYLSDFKILVFKSEQDLADTLKYLEGKDDEFLLNWEKQHDFISMRQAFEDIVADELNFSENPELVHSNLISKYPNSFVIEKTFDDCGFFDKNIHSDYLSKVVNPDGLIIVGDSIYQHTKDYIKVIKDGDLNKIPNLLSATTSISNLGIEVYSIKSGTTTFNRSCQSNDGRLRIIVYEDFIQNTSTSDPKQKATTYKVKVRSLQRRLWGLWYDNYKTNISLTGNHVGNSTYGWLTSNSYVFINWSGSYNVASNGQMHTFEIFLPYSQMPQSNPGLRTDGIHPEIYQSWHKGVASRSGKTATCTTVYP